MGASGRRALPRSPRSGMAGEETSGLNQIETNRPATAWERERMSEAQRAAYDAGTPFSYAECYTRVYQLHPIQGVPGAGTYIVQKPGAALRRVLTAMKEGGAT